MEGIQVPMSPEQKKAASDRMKAMHAAKKAAKLSQEQPVPEPTTAPELPPPEKKVEISEDKLNFILEELSRLKSQQVPQQPLQQATMGARGMVGSTEKYATNKSLYSDPRDRLFNEQEFQRFAIKDNYELTWDILVSRYQTAQGLWFTEPRFEMELRRLDLDEDGQVKRKYLIQKYVKHEDFDAAIDIARALGMEIDDTMSKDFIDEMRYQDIKMWLRELFFPPKTIQQSNGGKTEAVIGGTVVTVYENPKDLNRELQGV